MLPAPVPIDAGRGPAVVLLHPFPLEPRAWAPVADELAGGFRVLVPDLRGPDSLDDVAARVAAALDARGVRPAAVAGSSMGGYAALALAAARPDLVPALVLVGSRARADLPAERENRLRQIAALEADPGAAPALLHGWLHERLLAPAAPAAARQAVASMIEAAGADEARAALAAMAGRPDRTAVVRSFRGPFLALTGSEDAIIGPAEAEALAALAPSGRAATIDGAGHLPQLEQPARVAALLRKFLEPLRA